MPRPTWPGMQIGGTGRHKLVGAGEFMRDFIENDIRKAGISDKELMGLIGGSLAGVSARPGAVLFDGGR